MPVSPARLAAYEILLRVEQRDSYASELLHASRQQRLSDADHGLATELVMGVLRWRSRLDEAIQKSAGRVPDKLDPEVLTSLRIAAYQLGFLERIPARAAVHESVELIKRARKRSAVPFVNAVLRKLSGQAGKLRPNPGRPPQSAAGIAAVYAHPPWMVERWVEQFGMARTKQICQHNQSAPATAVHLAEPSAAESLASRGIELAPGELLRSARRLVSGAHSLGSEEGPAWIQDEASQLVALLLDGGEHILDCCAAPGGKAAILAERHPSALVVASDLHPHRADLLRRMSRTGQASNVRIVAADATTMPFKACFDRVLADVPCSGTGTLARHPEIKWRLKKEHLHELHQLQSAILNAAMDLLVIGGRVLYSTCSLDKEENEDVVQEILSSRRDLRVVDCRSELVHLHKSGELKVDPEQLVSGQFLRILPGQYSSDGFFAAILEKS